MNALVKKEIRLLLPSWIVAMLLALPPVCTRSDDGIPVFLLFMGMVMLALTSIGRETSLNTFSSLLAQPVERTRIWQTKLSVLAAAFLSVFVVWRLAIIFSFKDYGGGMADPEAAAAVLIAGFLTCLTAFTGGLWTTLLLRQIAGAFWLALLTPAVLAGFTAAFLAESQTDSNVIAVMCIVIGIYSVGGFLFARWLFFRAQDVGWTGGIIALPEWKIFSARSDASGSTRNRRPIFALLKKEFQLQQVSLMGATGLLVLHIGVLVLRANHKFAHESAGEILTSIFWILWLVLPVIVGAMSVAEERRLGVMEGQLCLPASRRVQFVIKGLVALFLGVLLGGVMPVLLEAIGGTRLTWDLERDSAFIMLVIVGLALWLAVVSFFASTLAKNFLQAVGFALTTFVGSAIIFPAFANGRMIFFDSLPTGIFLPLVIAVPTLLATLLLLAYLNFKDFRAGWPLWRRNLLGVTVAIIFIVVSIAGLYNRAWEVFEPMEPVHGPAKLSLINPPNLQIDNYNNLLVRLPDGRVWLDHLKGGAYDPDAHGIKWLLHLVADPLPKIASAQRFVAGSDWRSATAQRVDFLLNYKEGRSQPHNRVVGYLDTVGVKTNGTLWISGASKNGAWTGDQMNRFDEETNWQQAVRARFEIFLLKKNGTLWSWGWGTNRFDWSIWQTNWPSLRNYQPHQIGTDSNWQEICNCRWINFARKSDGTVWQVGFNDKIGEAALLREAREIHLDQASFQTLSLSGNGEMAYVRPDGTLWMSWNLQQDRTNQYSSFVRVGTEANWAAVALNWRRMTALKSDGSLWQWQFERQWNDSQNNLNTAAKVLPARMGIHNDWVAIANTWEGVIALAADGSLWLWPDRRQYEQYTLLKLPKQPQPLGNIFSTPN